MCGSLTILVSFECSVTQPQPLGLWTRNSLSEALTLHCRCQQHPWLVPPRCQTSLCLQVDAQYSPSAALSLSRVQLFATPWTVAGQPPLSMGVLQARVLEWLPFPSPGDLPNPGIEPRSPALQADSLLSEPPGKLGRCQILLQQNNLKYLQTFPKVAR